MSAQIKGDKSGVCYREWISPQTESILLLVHGLGAHSLRWKALAEFFLNNNISSYAIDLRGFGETAGEKGYVKSFSSYSDDIFWLRERIAEINPGKKIFLLGESMGALISCQTAALGPERFDGLICLSPAFSSNLEFTLMENINIFWNMIINSRKQFKMPFNSKMCTRDVEIQKLLELDEKEHRIAAAGILRGIAWLQFRSGKIARALNVPVLFMLAGRDKLVKSEVSEKVFRSIKTEDKKLIKYPEMHHALSIELGREKVFVDLLEWLRGRV